MTTNLAIFKNIFSSIDEHLVHLTVWFLRKYLENSGVFVWMCSFSHRVFIFFEKILQSTINKLLWLHPWEELTGSDLKFVRSDLQCGLLVHPRTANAPLTGALDWTHFRLDIVLLKRKTPQGYKSGRNGFGTASATGKPFSRICRCDVQRLGLDPVDSWAENYCLFFGL